MQSLPTKNNKALLKRIKEELSKMEGGLKFTD